MNISDMVFDMELAGVDAEHIAGIVELCKNKGFSSEMVDEELIKLGYPKIFTIEYDDYDEYNSFDDEDYYSMEKFSHKRQLRD
ncbi:hypothetical protein FJR48_06955 [Sulfurimonas lithotrophica]|uniref:Uncharacterized protein n=1 Tax=Sulfurimonas lithotrophica TaxID=2590022 RepID=A0A5P8P181_9BACT|nr:hypothetical protein [Sulfurimonas lithotrophica]QFR49482.1 hypothetical protein FJR48_06955 [Sulfurimonas lithotrophica]